MDSRMDIDLTESESPAENREMGNSTSRDQDVEEINQPGPSTSSQEHPRNPTTPGRLTKHVTLKYNSSRATEVIIEREPPEDRRSGATEPLSVFLFVPSKYWVDIKAPDRLFRVSSSPQEMPTWRMPLPEHIRCGIYISAHDVFIERNSHNVRTAFMPVFLVSKISKPFYIFHTCGRNIKEDGILLDRQFLDEKARLEATKLNLQSHMNDVEMALANYATAMSKWRSEVRRWEVQTIHDELKAGNKTIFRNRISTKDLEELDEWFQAEERKEFVGHYNTWYTGVLRQGHDNIYAPAHLLRSIPIKNLIEQRLEILREAVETLEEMIEDIEEDIEDTPMDFSPQTPRPVIDLPDYSSDEEEEEEEDPLDEEQLVNLTLWAYERHLHWTPRDARGKKKYKFRTEADVYKLFRIKKLTCSDPTPGVGNGGLFQQHIRLFQDLDKYPWGLPFYVLEKTVLLANHRELYSEEGRTILRDMETEYFNNPKSFKPETNLMEWSRSEGLARRIRQFLDRVSG